MLRTQFKLACILLCIAAQLAGCDKGKPPEKAFDETAWKAGDAWTRGGMVNSLVNSGILAGRNKAQVIGLLGRPDKDGPKIVSYLVEVGNPISYELYIHFSAAGDVEKYYVSD